MGVDNYRELLEDVDAIREANLECLRVREDPALGLVDMLQAYEKLSQTISSRIGDEAS